jgi:hypothetical protein
MSVDYNGTDTSIHWGSASTIDDIFDNANGGTAMAWINLDGWGEGNFGRIWDKTAWLFFVRSSQSDLVFIYNWFSANGYWTTPGSSLSLSTTFHVAATYIADDASTNPTLYINGVSQTVTEETTPVGFAPDSDASYNAYLGNSSAGDRTFNGRIGDPRLYKRILSAAEIQTIVNTRGHDGIIDDLRCKPSLEEGYPGQTGQTPKDLSQYKHTATTSGTITHAEAFWR